MSEPMLEVEGLVKAYGDDPPAVKGISFVAAPGEFVSLLGPSGCGKTTTLRCIAGLEQITDGRIVIGGRTVSDAGRFEPPERRGIGMVFQSYALWPHMTALDNVAYPLRRRGAKRTDAREQAAKALDTVGLAGFEGRYPHELSGGQQQRVAVARAGVGQPALLLFDEPLSNLDARLRERMRFELRELQQRLGVTSIYVTHDMAEAMVLSDRIVLMNDGEIVQSDPPARLYSNPETAFAARFLGSVNLIDGTVEAVHEGGRVSVRTPLGVLSAAAARSVTTGESVAVSVRPQFIDLAPAGEGILTGTLASVVFLGQTVEYQVDVGGTIVDVQDDRPSTVAVGDEVGLVIDESGITCLRDDVPDAAVAADPPPDDQDMSETVPPTTRRSS
jgi:iron(III) transport system ATP-binding protein